MSKGTDAATVIFIPGFMQPADAWTEVAQRLPERYPSVLLRHDRHERWGRLATLDLPLLALAGSRDERYRRAARRIASEAADGHAAVIEHAGHAAHLQRPGEFADALVAFIDERVRPLAQS